MFIIINCFILLASSLAPIRGQSALRPPKSGGSPSKKATGCTSGSCVGNCDVTKGVCPTSSCIANLLGGKNRFVLAASGHIAGVVNPPEGGKYNHFINEALPDSPDDWFAGATELAGSWWPDWQRWILSSSKAQVAARTPGDRKLTVLEDAPGSYVKVRVS